MEFMPKMENVQKDREHIRFFLFIAVFILTTALYIGFESLDELLPALLKNAYMTKAMDSAMSHQYLSTNELSVACEQGLTDDWILIPTHWYAGALASARAGETLSRGLYVLGLLTSGVLLSMIGMYRRKMIEAKLIQKAWYDSFLFGDGRRKKPQEFEGM